MKSSRQFYTELTPEGLEKRKEKEHTNKEIRYLKRILNKKQRILDLACGYGRFSIRLAKQGYKIEGIDITPSLISKAKKLAKKEKVDINFRVGDMRKLPYKDESFDAVICMWSAFNELHKEKDQEAAVREMLRTLSFNGFAFIEMPHHKSKGVTTFEIDGVKSMPSYNHNKTTIANLMKRSKIKKFRVYLDDFGGRRRLLLQFWKN